jgi:hypothetical protein
MKKKIISLLLMAAISSTALISCGNTKTTEASNDQKPETEQASSPSSSPNDSSNKDSNIVGENNKPTVEVAKIATISDFKDKDKTAVETLLGKATSEDDTKTVYEKENYTFEVTYSDSKCKTLKIIPKSEMKFPADATNILKLVGIDADQSDKLTPAGLEWNNKFDVLKVTVVSNNEPEGKIKFAEILFN